MNDTTMSIADRTVAKQTALKTMANQVRYTLNRKDLLPWERDRISIALRQLEAVRDGKMTQAEV